MQSVGAGAVLVVDTCGEHGSVALFAEDRLLAEVVLQQRTASASLLSAVRDVLLAAGLELRELSGIGVVNGPGSFTGLRVGLAVVKGLCESADLPIGAVSRLDVLAERGSPGTKFAVLRAGRDEVYVREQGSECRARERMLAADAFVSLVAGQKVVYTEETLAGLLTGTENQRVELSARHAIGAVRRCLREGGSDASLLDANYVRDEQAIYVRKQASF